MTKKEEVLKIPKELPVLPVRDIVVFPYMIIPLFVARSLSINAIDEALAKDRMIFLATQKDQSVEEPTPDQLYGVGTVALILHQWICSSRDGTMPSGVRIWTSIASSVACRFAESMPSMPSMAAVGGFNPINPRSLTSKPAAVSCSVSKRLTSSSEARVPRSSPWNPAGCCTDVILLPPTTQAPG